MVFLPSIRSPELWILQSSPKVTIKINCVALIVILSSISGVDCTTDDMVKKMTTHICGTKRVMWWTPEGEENKIHYFCRNIIMLEAATDAVDAPAEDKCCKSCCLLMCFKKCSCKFLNNFQNRNILIFSSGSSCCEGQEDEAEAVKVLPSEGK